MSHPHDHTHTHTENIRVAFFLNLGFTLFEVIGGLYTNSLAILSDALHDLGDSFSLGMAWYLERHSHKESDVKYSYGYRRFSLLAALINTIVLIAGSIYILSEAIPRLLHPEHSNAGGMVVLAVVGIAVNGFAALRVRSEGSLNAQVISWHLLEVVLGWAAVLIVSISLLITDIHILDPILNGKARVIEEGESHEDRRRMPLWRHKLRSGNRSGEGRDLQLPGLSAALGFGVQDHRPGG
ncbi:MAG: cation diffusion facilitator family transporter, partial [Anaerolineales bacterium]